MELGLYNQALQKVIKSIHNTQRIQEHEKKKRELVIEATISNIMELGEWINHQTRSIVSSALKLKVSSNLRKAQPHSKMGSLTPIKLMLL